jgi:hypothetical protein
MGDKVNSPSSKCGVWSAECGMGERQIPPHPNPLPEERVNRLSRWV